MKVLLKKGAWLTDRQGDHYQTLEEEYAKEYKTIAEASKALAEARRYGPFENAQIVDDVF